MQQAISDIQQLLEVGGTVLTVIFFVALLMWTLIIERFWYILWVHPEQAIRVARDWDGLEDKLSWESQVVRRLWISQIMMDLGARLALIRSLVSVCPLLGLLGTTTGMVEVYEVMAIEGSGDPRGMAAGVSQAMVTTMAGLVVALSGIFFSARLENMVVREREHLDAQLPIERDLLAHQHRARSQEAKERTRRAEELRRRLADLRRRSEGEQADEPEIDSTLERSAAGR